MKTASVNIRIQENIKEQAEKILSQLGLSRAVAIDLFYRQIIMNNGIPFSLTVPKQQVPIRDTMSEEEFHTMMNKECNMLKIMDHKIWKMYLISLHWKGEVTC